MTARPATAGLLRDGRPPLLRLLALARPLRGRLLLAVAAGAAATGCGVSRYLERLASHDVAFRVLAQVRVTIWRRLEALAPAGAVPGVAAAFEYDIEAALDEPDGH